MALATPAIFQTPRFTPQTGGVFGTNFLRSAAAQPASVGQGMTTADVSSESLDRGGRDVAGKSAQTQSQSLGEGVGQAAARGQALGKETGKTTYAQIGRGIGAIAGLATKATGLGTIGMVAGTVVDALEAQAQMNALGMEGFGIGGFASAVANSMSFGALGQSYSTQTAQALATAWDTDMANAAYNFDPDYTQTQTQEEIDATNQAAYGGDQQGQGVGTGFGEAGLGGSEEEGATSGGNGGGNDSNAGNTGGMDGSDSEDGGW